MEKQQKTDYGALAIITTLFFMWGFLTCMNDILIPYLKGIFALSHLQAMLVQLAFFGAYFLGSLVYFILSSRIGDPINKIGYKNGITIGLLLAAVGTALFYPAAELVSYPFFLAALFILGLGFTILQISANPYAAILGSPETASGRLNLCQGFNSIGTTIAPVIGSFLIFTFFAGKTGADAVEIPYLVFSLVLILLAIFIRASKLPEFRSDEKVIKGAGALKYPHLLLGMLGIFMYVGAEVSIGSIMINFLGLPEIAGFDATTAGQFVAFYWGGLMIGRFSGAISLSAMDAKKKSWLMIAVPVIAFLVVLYSKGITIAGIFAIFLVLNSIMFRVGKFLPARTLSIFAVTAAILVCLTMLTSGHLSMWLLVGTGLFNSIMWSNIFTLSIDGLGKYTSQGSSLLVMAILGGALLPLLEGWLADIFGVHYCFWGPLVSYIYITYYGLKGYKYKKTEGLTNE